MVGATGFEPATSSTPWKRAIQTALRPDIGRDYSPPGGRMTVPRGRSSTDRAPVFGTGGWGFESLRPRHNLAMSDLPSQVDKLGELLARHALTSIRVKNGDQVIEVRRDPQANHDAANAVPGTHLPAHAATTPLESPRQGIPIPAPMVGTYYRRPIPSDPPFVEVGDRITIGQVIGVIEAMKVFNEVESPISGVVRALVAEDGQLVQEGDTLLLIES